MNDLQNIETFAEVAGQLSFAGAARRLGLPPSTVTSRVRALEQSLGVRLLDRTTRSTALTAEGAVFLERCQRALTEIEAARSLVSADVSASGPVRLSVPTALPMDRLARLIRDFLARHPKIHVDITVEDRATDFVRDGIDVALRGHRPGGADLIARLLSQMPVHLVAPPGRLRDESLPILGPLTRHLNSSTLPGQAHCESFALARELTLAGAARACLPLSLCEQDAKTGSVEIAPPPPGVESQLGLYLVYQDRRHQPQRVRLFIDALVAEFSSPSEPAQSR
ncbi:LysR family transcriptional regulator [Tritonibacter mobilis]|uniref:LysR family transcriptional regulator n=1 Tax=Tritonibacter mobilis TaxID=379347 RepID=UPI000806AAD5|nr:LysR family transcriptional regulator [Tritonibacter mobilis]